MIGVEVDSRLSTVDKGGEIVRGHNRENVMAALLTSSTQAEAARRAGVSDRLVRQYLAKDDFKAELSQRRRETIEGAARALQSSLQSAVDALRGIVENGENESSRIAAARALLEYGLRFTELVDVLESVERLEKIITEDK